MILTRPKQIGAVQNDWYWTKMIWTFQNEAVENKKNVFS